MAGVTVPDDFSDETLDDATGTSVLPAGAEDEYAAAAAAVIVDEEPEEPEPPLQMAGGYENEPAYSTITGNQQRGGATGLETEEERLQLYGVSPRYDLYYARRTLNSMSAAQLSVLEERLWAAGYNVLEDSSGLRSSGLVAAFENLIVEADTNRNEWEDQLDESVRLWQDQKEERDKANRVPFLAPTRLKPDYATLSQRVKADVAGQLGRKPTSSEMKLLTGNLEGHYRDEYTQETYRRARSEWEQRSRATLTGDDQNVGAVVSDVDPLARYAEDFDERFEGELAHRDRTQQVQETQGSMFGSLDMASRMVG